ncbi:MAG TPA: ABC transporter ATP-binding protein [bacterium]|nr:ABC transporter ATP-binding protein [bacterium]
MLLRASDISKRFQKKETSVQALDHVSLELANGEFVAIHGPSGSGKTTLLLLAGGLLAPDKGEIFLNGKNPYKMMPDQRARFRAETVGFVFQQFHLIPYLTVLENVMAPSVALPMPERVERGKELLDRFAMLDRADHVSAELSTGERQRTALARALFNKPALILADEPTGNLDDENASVVLKTLSEHAAQGGGVLLVTHDPKAASLAHRTLHLRQGALVQ